MVIDKYKNILLAVLPGLICFSCNSYLFYKAPRYDEQMLQQIESDPRVIEITYNMSFGQQTSFYIKPINEADHVPKRLWILFGGISSPAFGWYQWFKDMPDSCCGLLLVEYPGYGKCEGIPREERILASSLEAFEELAKYLDVPRNRLEEDLGLLGHSLGSLTMLQFAPYVQADEILLISPISSLSDQVKYLYGGFKGSLLNMINPENYNNRERLKELLKRNDPPETTIIHGGQDKDVPVKMGRELAALSDSIQYYEISAMGHSGLIEQEMDLIRDIMFND